MSRDPERFSSAEMASEDIDDAIGGAGNDVQKLKMLLRFFEELYEISKPYLDMSTGKISAPDGQLPLEEVTPEVLSAVNQIDPPFADTMSYVTWVQTLKDGYLRIEAKIKTLEGGESFGESLK